MKKHFFSGLLLTTSTLAVAAADFNIEDYNNANPQDSSTEAYNQSLLAVPITDSRSSRENVSAISSMTRMTRADIERSGARSVAHLLQQIPGIQFSRTGGQSGLSSFYIRGSEADTTLVLVNDVRVQSLNTGFSAIADLPIASIERLEVVRGAQSTLYGSTAPGGIIKIYTTPQKHRASFNFENAASDQGDVQSSIGGAGTIGDLQLFGSGNWSNREGVNSCADINACFLSAPETDLDGIEKLNGQAGFKLFSDQGASLQVSHLYNNARSEFDGSFSNESELTQKITSAQLAIPVTQRQQIRLEAGQFNEFYQSFLDSNGDQATRNQYGTDRYTSSLIHEASLLSNSDAAQLTLMSGVDYDHSTIVDSSAYPKINRETTGAFSELEFALNGATLRLGGRRDRYDEESIDIAKNTNYATTGHLKLKLDITNQLAIKTSTGRSFNMPTFSELYYPGFGNPDLGPETHTSQDIGVEFQSGTYDASVFFFRTKSKDLIVFDSVTFAPVSIGEANIRGVELQQNVRLDQLQFGTNLTYLNAIDSTPGSDEKQLARRPELQFSGYLGLEFNNAFARLGMLSSGSRFDDTANTVKVGGYTIFDFNFNLKATQNLNLGFRVENLFDKVYETANGYNQPDRSVWLDIQYSIR